MDSFLFRKMATRHYKLVITAIICCILAGCQIIGSQPDSRNQISGSSMPYESSNYKEYLNTEFKYKIQIPYTAYRHTKSTTGASIGFGTISFLADPKPNDFEIGIDVVNAKCSPSITGSSQTSPLVNAGADADWGRVDAYDTPESLDREPVLCSPPKVSWLIDAEGNAKLESSAYALCSEKDGKTVVICIGQMTDNPEMAKQIFETFRWVE